MTDDDDDTFTFDEMRIALTAFALWLLKDDAAFALWLLKDEPGAGIEVELVDRFIRETTSDEETTE